MQNQIDWIFALKRAALPGAARIEFGRTTELADNSTAYSMNSYAESGEVLGDDRDYDLLKVVFTPLERLAAAIDVDFQATLDITSETLTLKTSD